MFKSILSLLFFLPAAFAFDAPAKTSTPTEVCVCPEITNLRKTGQTSTSISYSWSAPTEATLFQVWYVRHSDDYTSESFYTTNCTFTFANLSQGLHTFYFVVLCGSEPSGLIGVTDLIQA